MISKIFENNLTLSILISILSVILLSILFGYLYTKINKNKIYKKEFVYTLILIPIIVVGLVSVTSVIIDTLINTDSQIERAIVALAGAILVIRFRTKNIEPLDLTYIFFEFVYSFIIGLGYLYLGLVFYGLFIITTVIINKINIVKLDNTYILRICMPEDLEFEEEFKETLGKYTKYNRLYKIKSADMGTTFILTYYIDLIDSKNIKAMLDDIRIKNGNMSITLNKKMEVDVD